MSERTYFSAKIEDLIEREASGEAFAFSGFLTVEEAAEAEIICRRFGAPFFLYGGYSESERKVLVVSSMDPETLLSCFPITLLQVHGRRSASLSHRDILGALMALGIRRDLLGDIIVREGYMAFFALDHIKDYLIQNLTQIGHESVKLSEASPDFEIPASQFETIRLTVASLRADAVISGIARVSREQASRLIDDKFVFLNHRLLEKKTKLICAGDCLVVRKRGKWIIDMCEDTTKKGRSVLLCRKYI